MDSGIRKRSLRERTIYQERTEEGIIRCNALSDDRRKDNEGRKNGGATLQKSRIKKGKKKKQKKKGKKKRLKAQDQVSVRIRTRGACIFWRRKSIQEAIRYPHHQSEGTVNGRGDGEGRDCGTCRPREL